MGSKLFLDLKSLWLHLKYWMADLENQSFVSHKSAKVFSTIVRLVKHPRRDGNFEITGPRGLRVLS